MDFVINEWFPEYLIPSASLEERLKVIDFLNAFMSRNDRLVVRNPSAFINKIYRFLKRYNYDSSARENLKKVITLILKNSEKCLIISNDSIDLPIQTNDLLNEEGGNYNSDRYLFEAALQTNQKIIVTTDVKLRNQMSEDEVFEVILLDDFLEKYYY